MASEHLQTFTDNNFEADVLKAAHPVLVDFWAEWCGPCRAMEPSIHALAGDYAGKVSVGKLNVDENPSVTMHVPFRERVGDSECYVMCSVNAGLYSR